MQYSLALLGLVASLASAVPQGVTQSISPPESAPPGCMKSFPDSFSITTVNVTTSTKVKRQTNAQGGLKITIQNGIMKDNEGDTGYIAANHQFQFDKPPQTGAIYTAGWSVCSNKTIALGGSTIFYSCNSGNFNNLYSTSQGKQCSQVFISAEDSGSAASGSSSGSSSESSSMMSSAAVSQTSDAQPQAATTAAASSAVSTIADNQPQAATTAAASSAVSTIADNQPQAPTSAAAGISTIADNQPQAPTMAANATFTYAVATGAAVVNRPEVMALAAGAMALLF